MTEELENFYTEVTATKTCRDCLHLVGNFCQHHRIRKTEVDARHNDNCYHQNLAKVLQLEMYNNNLDKWESSGNYYQLVANAPNSLVTIEEKQVTTELEDWLQEEIAYYGSIYNMGNLFNSVDDALKVSNLIRNIFEIRHIYSLFPMEQYFSIKLPEWCKNLSCEIVPNLVNPGDTLKGTTGNIYETVTEAQEIADKINDIFHSFEIYEDLKL